MTTVYVILALIAPALAYEAYALTAEDVRTWSRAFRYLGHEWSPFTAYALSVLVGHFYVQPPAQYTLAYRLDEVGEVAFVLWLGWTVFVVGKAVTLPWWGYLLLIMASVLVGAFCWTIGH